MSQDSSFLQLYRQLLICKLLHIKLVLPLLLTGIAMFKRFRAL